VRKKHTAVGVPVNVTEDTFGEKVMLEGLKTTPRKKLQNSSLFSLYSPLYALLSPSHSCTLHPNSHQMQQERQLAQLEEGTALSK
jgi:hypothetical protein